MKTSQKEARKSLLAKMASTLSKEEVAMVGGGECADGGTTGGQPCHSFRFEPDECVHDS